MCFSVACGSSPGGYLVRLTCFTVENVSQLEVSGQASR